MSNTALLRQLLLTILLVVGFMAHSQKAHAGRKETAIVAGGCFWCVESDFESVPGVIEVISGFTGGRAKNPSYRQVSRGGTGHFEAVKIIYDPARISYEKILHLFFRSIDPTDAGGQFCDRGPTYRTAIFYQDKRQKAAALAARREAQRALGRRIVTQILPARRFYPAGAYHQNYYKSRDRVITRFGIRRKADAYRAYRRACGRDRRVRQLWGRAAPFASRH